MDNTPTSEKSALRDSLTGALIGLARAIYAEPPGPGAWQALGEGLAALAADPDAECLRQLAGKAREQKRLLTPGCAGCAAPCGRTADYDPALLCQADGITRGLKELLLRAARSMAACALPAGQPLPEELNWMLAKLLFAAGEDWEPDLLAPLLPQAGGLCLSCFSLEGQTEPEDFCRLLAELNRPGSVAPGAGWTGPLSPFERQALEARFPSFMSGQR